MQEEFEEFEEDFEEFGEQEDSFNEENNNSVSPAFQWLPRGICQESTFNRFIAKESVSLHPVTIESIPRHPSDFRRLTQLLRVSRD